MHCTRMQQRSMELRDEVEGLPSLCPHKDYMEFSLHRLEIVILLSYLSPSTTHWDKPHKCMKLPYMESNCGSTDISIVFSDWQWLFRVISSFWEALGDGTGYFFNAHHITSSCIKISCCDCIPPPPPIFSCGCTTQQQTARGGR